MGNHQSPLHYDVRCLACDVRYSQCSTSPASPLLRVAESNPECLLVGTDPGDSCKRVNARNFSFSSGPNANRRSTTRESSGRFAPLTNQPPEEEAARRLDGMEWSQITWLNTGFPADFRHSASHRSFLMVTLSCCGGDVFVNGKVGSEVSVNLLTFGYP